MGMEPSNRTSDTSRDLIRAAGETLELMCRLRGIALETLTDDELGEFFLNAMAVDA